MFIDLFPTILFSNSLKEFLEEEFNSYIHFILNTELEKDQIPNSFTTINQRILDLPIFSKIKKYSLDYYKIYLKEMGHKVFDIQIQNSWANVLHNNSFIQSHIHSNSYISGVFYPNDASPISFSNPLLEKYVFKAEIRDNLENPKNFQNIDYLPRAGDLILFPSWLSHQVKFNNRDNRVSIAFNIIPKGEFGWNSAKLYL